MEGQKSVSNDTNKEKHHVGGILFLREKLLVKTKKNGSRNIVEVQQGNCSVRARVAKKNDVSHHNNQLLSHGILREAKVLLHPEHLKHTQQ